MSKSQPSSKTAAFLAACAVRDRLEEKEMMRPKRRLTPRQEKGFLVGAFAAVAASVGIATAFTPMAGVAFLIAAAVAGLYLAGDNPLLDLRRGWAEMRCEQEAIKVIHGKDRVVW